VRTEKEKVVSIFILSFRFPVIIIVALVVELEVVVLLFTYIVISAKVLKKDKAAANQSERVK